jgi:hypothetical protein
MKKKIFLVCTCCLCIFSGIYAQVSVLKWQSSLLEIDGNPNDWTTELRFFHSNSGLKYEFRNDASNLYFVFKSDDVALKRQLAQAGMKLKFMVKSEKGKTSYFELKKSLLQPFPGHFPPPPSADQVLQNGQNPPPLLNSGGFQGSMMPIIVDTAFVRGFYFADEQIYSGNSKPNSIIFAKSSPAIDEVAFEMQVPIRELFGDNYNLNEIVNIPIKFQLTINALSQSEMKSTGARNVISGMENSGMRAPGMGGGSPEMGGGAPGMRGGGERPPMPNGMPQSQNVLLKKTFKTSFRLVNQ